MVKETSEKAEKKKEENEKMKQLIYIEYFYIKSNLKIFLLFIM